MRILFNRCIWAESAGVQVDGCSTYRVQHWDATTPVWTGGTSNQRVHQGILNWSVQVASCPSLTWSSSACVPLPFPGNFSSLRVNFVLKRDIGFYIIQIYIPCILIVILSWVSFWLSLDAVPARISLGVLTVLTMTTQTSGLTSRLPRVSYIKAIDVWLSTCLVFVFAALLEFAVVNVMCRKQAQERRKRRKRNKKQGRANKTNDIALNEVSWSPITYLRPFLYIFLMMIPSNSSNDWFVGLPQNPSLDLRLTLKHKLRTSWSSDSDLISD